MRFELKMAIRHLRAGGSQTVLIVGGVAVAVTLVIFVNGLIRGVQKELTDRITGSLPHVTVEAPEMVPRKPVDIAQRYPDATVAWNVQKRPTSATPLMTGVTPRASCSSFPTSGRCHRASPDRQSCRVQARKWASACRVPSPSGTTRSSISVMTCCTAGF